MRSVVVPVVAPVVVMGVTGSGKSTVGVALAAALGVRFVDADALHPSANVEKMAAGIPLTDDDRAPWLDAVGAILAPGSVVVACSALRRAYRDRLRAAAPKVRFVHLHGGRELLLERMTGREHFMPVTLLDSQLAVLETPDSDEHALAYDVAEPVDAIVVAAAHRLAPEAKP